MRGTADVDLLGQLVSNRIEDINDIFTDIFRIEYPEDGIVYDIGSLQTKRISEFKKYPGVRISVEGFLDRTKVMVHIDLGFGDSVYPQSVSMEYPTLLEQPAPIIRAYSKESVIAEKFEAIVSLGKANSRMKDFYDLYALIHSFDFDRMTIAEAIQETFSNRHTPLDDIIAFHSDFAMDANRKKMWKAFIDGKNISLNIELEDVIPVIMNFLTPLVSRIRNQTVETGRWNCKTLSWTDG